MSRLVALDEANKKSYGKSPNALYSHFSLRRRHLGGGSMPAVQISRSPFESFVANRGYKNKSNIHALGGGGVRNYPRASFQRHYSSTRGGNRY